MSDFPFCCNLLYIYTQIYVYLLYLYSLSVCLWGKISELFKFRDETSFDVILYVLIIFCCISTHRAHSLQQTQQIWCRNYDERDVWRGSGGFGDCGGDLAWLCEIVKNPAVFSLKCVTFSLSPSSERHVFFLLSTWFIFCFRFNLDSHLNSFFLGVCYNFFLIANIV